MEKISENYVPPSGGLISSQYDGFDTNIVGATKIAGRVRYAEIIVLRFSGIGVVNALLGKRNCWHSIWVSFEIKGKAKRFEFVQDKESEIELDNVPEIIHSLDVAEDTKRISISGIRFTAQLKRHPLFSAEELEGKYRLFRESVGRSVIEEGLFTKELLYSKHLTEFHRTQIAQQGQEIERLKAGAKKQSPRQIAACREGGKNRIRIEKEDEKVIRNEWDLLKAVKPIKKRAQLIAHKCAQVKDKRTGKPMQWGNKTKFDLKIERKDGKPITWRYVYDLIKNKTKENN